MREIKSLKIKSTIVEREREGDKVWSITYFFFQLFRVIKSSKIKSTILERVRDIKFIREKK